MTKKSGTKVIDLASLDTASDTAVLTLRHPATHAVLTDEGGKPIAMTVCGTDSETYLAAQRTVLNKRLSRRNRTPLTAEEIEDEAIDIIAKCVVSWNGIVLDGDLLVCSPENVRKVLSRFRWIKEQVDEFINDRANFVKASAKN